MKRNKGDGISVPDGSMFKLFHLFILAGTGILVPLLCGVLNARGEKTVNAFLRFCGIAVLFFDPIYWLWEIKKFGSIDFSTTLPLYICSLFWMLLPIAAFAEKERLQRAAASCICTICLLGGIFGLVFNVYLNQYPPLSFVPLRSLLYHIMMILTAAVMWSSGYYRPRRGDQFLCILPLAALLVPCLLLNKLFGWDYCYTAGGIGTPLEHLSAVMPKAVFLLIVYGGLFLLIRFVFYRKFNLTGSDMPSENRALRVKMR